MDEIIKKQVMDLKGKILDLFKRSGKKHLLITGSRGRGKTTVLNEILRDESSYGGITTYVIRDDKIPPKYVMLRDMKDHNLEDTIARRNEEATGLSPIINTFENLAINILDKYINSAVELIIIDEIGFLENDAMEYQRKVLESLDSKSCIFVMRKESTRFIEEIINRDDVFLVDIDEI